jgi:hypothetical protein
MAMSLLNIAAVPFTMGSFPNNTIAARRQTRRSAGPCSTPAQPSSAPTAAPFEYLDAEKRAIIAIIVNEAAKEIQSVMGLGLQRESELESFPSQPPNSPNDATSFEFPILRLNRQDGLPTRRNISQDIETTSEEEEAALLPEKPKRTRSFRKRRRVPSFKTGQQPRVPAKVGCSNSEADDESSEPETLTIAKSRVETNTDDVVTEKELELKLNLLSETRRSMKQDDIAEWAKVGTELRNIADSFQKGLDSDGDDETGSVDIFALINLMLPVSVPQSLWSALVSYAAWKIFKRFQ